MSASSADSELVQRLLDIFEGARTRAGDLRRQLREAEQEVEGLRRSLSALGVEVAGAEHSLSAGEELRDEAFRVLAEADPYQRGMRLREILEILEDEGFRIDGADPANTLRGAIYRNRRFRVVARGVITWNEPGWDLETLVERERDEGRR